MSAPRRAKINYAGYALHGKVVEVIRDEVTFHGVPCAEVRNPFLTNETLLLPRQNLMLISEDETPA